MKRDQPPLVDLLWGARGHGTDDRKRPLTLDRIIDAAIELADADGIAAVSMGRIANHLGFSPMALYRHVRNKEELLVLMVNTAVGDPDFDEGDAALDWRTRLMRWYGALLETLSCHPWVVHVPINNSPSTPSQLAWLNAGLLALADTPLTETEKAGSILLLNGYAFWVTLLQAETVEMDFPSNLGTTPSATTALMQLLDEQRFSALRKGIDAGIFKDDSAATYVRFGLDRILDGIEHILGERVGFKSNNDQ